jgi:hypothetical protein
MEDARAESPGLTDVKEARMTDAALDLAPKSGYPVMVGKAIANFVIGTVAGLSSVFLPRMMLLLSIDTEFAPDRSISLFRSDFVWLGVAFGVVIGAISAILEFEGDDKPKAIFMTALGIPALLSGVLTTTSATTKLQKAEQEKVAVLRAVGAQADLPPQQRSNSFEPVGGAPGPQGRDQSSTTFFAFVTPAFAQSRSSAAQQTPRFDPGIVIERPRYVLALRRASSQDEALRLAKELQKDVPTAQAVKTDEGFLVVDSVTARSEAEALLDAIQLKSKRKLTPWLLQVPR